jgi:hypothetical protein
MKNKSILVIFITAFFYIFSIPHYTEAVLVVGCLSNDKECLELQEDNNWCNTNYPNTHYAGIDENNDRICNCKFGYEWDEDKTRCDLMPELVKSKAPSIFVPPTTQSNCKKIDGFFITGLSYDVYLKARTKAGCDINAPIPTREEDQICQSHYGANSLWNGRKNQDDGPICDCKTGYLYDSAQKTCLLTAVPVIQIATATPSTTKTVVIQTPTVETLQPQKSTTTEIAKIVGIEEVIPNIKESKTLSSSATSSISKSTSTIATTSTTTVQELPHKSIWSRLISWLGF